MITLYQVPFSHFCEQVRWILDYKELEFVAYNVFSGGDYAKIAYKSKQKDLPILQDGTHWQAGTLQIAQYIEQTYPEFPLLPPSGVEREQVLALVMLCQALGVCVRQWLFYYILQNQQHPAFDIMLGEQGWLKKSTKLSLPALQLALKRKFKIDATSAQIAKQQLDIFIEQFNAILLENRSQSVTARFLCTTRFTLADIALCSTLAPLLLIAHTPWQVESLQHLDSELLDYREQLLKRPIGQYVVEIYQSERQARVDWRGI